MTSYQSELDRAGYAVRDKVGKVLSSGSEIMSLRDRASQFRGTNNPQVNSLADAVMAKANGLLTNYKSIEGDSVSLLSQANDMRAKMDTDPVWKVITGGDMSNFGWETLARAKDYIGAATSLTQRMVGLASRADSHLAAVSRLRNDESSLEDYAQGKGIKALAESALSFGTGYVSMLKYAAIGIGLFFVWDIAKPFVVARGKR